MGVEVCDFSEHEEGKTSVEQNGAYLVHGCGGVRPEDPVSNVAAGKNPVVATIFDDVAGRHCGIAKTVDEKGFIFTLDKVGCEKRANEQLKVAGIGDGVEIEIDVWSKRVKDKSRD
jgi:hypothetical protein